MALVSILCRMLELHLLAIHVQFVTLLRLALNAVTQEEIEALYKRFRTLDRGRKVRCTSTVV